MKQSDARIDAPDSKRNPFCGTEPRDGWRAAEYDATCETELCDESPPCDYDTNRPPILAELKAFD